LSVCSAVSTNSCSLPVVRDDAHDAYNSFLATVELRDVMMLCIGRGARIVDDATLVLDDQAVAKLLGTSTKRLCFVRDTDCDAITPFKDVKSLMSESGVVALVWLSPCGSMYTRHTFRI
jgi:hypothetical protein